MDEKFWGVDNSLDKNIVFNCDGSEMLRVTPDSFYVRGVKIEQGPEEAQAVYNAIRQIILWDTLKR